MKKHSFDEIKRKYEVAKEVGLSFAQGTLAQYSDFMQQDDDNDWSAGRGADNWVGTYSRGVDKLLAFTGLPQAFGDVTGAVGSGVDSLVGNTEQRFEKVGRSVGEGLPRSIGQIGLIAGSAASGVGFPAAVAMTSAAIADAGAKGYADTGSVGAGVGSAALTGLAPGIGSVGSKLGLKMLPAALAESGGARVAASLTGEQLAQTGAGLLEQKFQGNPITADTLFAEALGTVAFAPLSVGHAREVYRNTPKGGNGKVTLMQGDGVHTVPIASEGSVKQDTQVFDYLLGVPSDRVPVQFQNTDFQEMLRLTGLEPSITSPKISGPSGPVIKGPRGPAVKGPKGPVVKGPKGPVVEGPKVEGPKVDTSGLMTKAKILLEQPTEHLTEIVDLVQTSNKLHQSDPAIDEALGRFEEKVMGPKTETDRFGGVQELMQFPKAVEGPRMSKLPVNQTETFSGVPDGTSKDGYFTAKSLRTELERAQNVEPTADLATARVVQKVKNKLARQASEQPLESPAMRMMSRGYDNLGLHPAFKQFMMQATERLHNFIDTGKATFTDAQNAVQAYPDAKTLENLHQVRGLFYPEQNIVSVHTAQPWRNTEIGAADLMLTFSHESTHALIELVDSNIAVGVDDHRGVALAGAREHVKPMGAEEKVQGLRDAYEALFGKKKLGNAEEYMKGAWERHHSSTPDEYLTEFGAIFAVAKANQGQKLAYMRFLPEPMQNFVKAMFRGIDELKTVLFAGAKARGQDLGKLEGFFNNLDVLYSKDPVMEQMKATVEKGTRMASALEQENLAGVGVRLSKIEGDGGAFEWATNLLDSEGSGRFARNFATHQQVSAGPRYRETIPEYGKLVYNLAMKDGEAARLNHAFLRDFMISVDGGRLQHLSTIADEKLSGVQKEMKSALKTVSESRPLTEAISNAGNIFNRLVDKASKEGGAWPTFDSPEIQDRIKGKVVNEWTGKETQVKPLTPEETAQVRHIFESYIKSGQELGIYKKAHNKQKFVRLAREYLYGQGIPYNEAPARGQELMDAIWSGQVQWLVRPEPPSQVNPNGVQGILQGNLSPDLLVNPGSVSMMKHWERTRDAFEKSQAIYEKPYLSEFRTGRFGVRFRQLQADGTWLENGYRSSDSKRERDAIVAGIERRSDTQLIDGDIDHHKDPKARFGQIQVKGLEEVANLAREHQRALVENGRPELAELLADAGYDAGEPFIAALEAEQKNMAQRNFAPGREYINMIETQNAVYSLEARKIANETARYENAWLLKSENWTKEPLLKAEVSEFNNNILNAGRREYQGFTKATSFVALAGNVSTAGFNGMQPWTMGVPRLTQDVGVVKAYKYVAEGYTQAFKPLDKITDPDFKALLIHALDRGVGKNSGSLDSLITGEDLINNNIIRASEGRDLVDMKKELNEPRYLMHKAIEMISSLSEKAFKVGMTPMRITEDINFKVMLYAGYKAGTEMGLTGKARQDYAINTHMVTNLGGGNAAHSSIKFKGNKLNGLIMAATQMTNYPIAAYSQMYSSWQGMLSKTALTPAQRARSAQAFGVQLLTQFALAGVGGMGMNALFAVAKEWFGIDSKDAIRKGLATIDESGTLGEVMLNGVANQITGYDISSRFDLSGIGGFNSYTGFDAKGMFGAGGGLISALYNAPSQIQNGDLGRVQLIPNGIRQVLAGIDGSAYKDRSGQTLIEPTASERFGQMLGLKPARMREAREQQAQMRDIQERVSQQNIADKQQMGVWLKEGNMPKVLQMLGEKVNEDMQLPEYASASPVQQRVLKERLLREKMMDLVQYTVEKALPLDPMDSGTGQAGSEMGASAVGFGDRQAPRRSELQTLKMKHDLMAQIGIRPPRNLPKAIRNAQRIDEVQRQNPTLTRSQVLEYIRTH